MKNKFNINIFFVYLKISYYKNLIKNYAEPINLIK